MPGRSEHKMEDPSDGGGHGRGAEESPSGLALLARVNSMDRDRRGSGASDGSRPGNGVGFGRGELAGFSPGDGNLVRTPPESPSSRHSASPPMSPSHVPPAERFRQGEGRDALNDSLNDSGGRRNGGGGGDGARAGAASAVASTATSPTGPSSTGPSTLQRSPVQSLSGTGTGTGTGPAVASGDRILIANQGGDRSVGGVAGRHSDLFVGREV